MKFWIYVWNSLKYKAVLEILKEQTSFYKVFKTNWIAGYGSGIESGSHYRNITLTSL